MIRNLRTSPLPGKPAIKAFDLIKRTNKISSSKVLPEEKYEQLFNNICKKYLTAEVKVIHKMFLKKKYPELDEGSILTKLTGKLEILKIEAVAVSSTRKKSYEYDATEMVELSELLLGADEVISEPEVRMQKPDTTQ